MGGDGIGGEHRDHADPIRDDAPVQSDPDKEEIEITVSFQRALTQSERSALEDLADAVSDASIAINAIPDHAEITLSNGAKVSGSELKEVWGKTDFVINEVGTTYRNNSDRGEADYNGGDPRVSLNIDNVEGYAKNHGGVNYLVLHELGHMTAAGRASNQLHAGAPEQSPGWLANERIANDTAHAIADSFGLNILHNPDAGYSSSIPMFTVPSPPPPPPPSGGGGGGGGNPGGPRQPFLMWYDL